MANQYKNKIQLANGTVLMDISSDTVTADKMLSGITAHDKTGAPVQGSIASKAAATYNTKTSNQTIAAGQYLSGKQTIRGVTTANIDANNIKDGVVVKVGDSASTGRIKNVTGTFTDASTVSSGQTAAGAGQILSGYSAWVNGAEVKGTWSLQNNVYPVGSLWATYDGTAVPSTVLGFGAWTKVSPIEATWNRLKQTTTWAEMSMDAPTIYVWKRTA